MRWVGWFCGPAELGLAGAMEYEEDYYEPSCFEKFTQNFLYCFIPTLCMMFDASFIVVGLICLVGSDGDFDMCSGDRESAIGACTPAQTMALTVLNCAFICVSIASP